MTPEQREALLARLAAGRLKAREAHERRKAEKRAAEAGVQLPTAQPTTVTQQGPYRMWADGRIEAYGSLWPLGMDEARIEASLYANAETRGYAPGALAQHEHFIRYLKLLVPETAFAWHRWAYEGAELFCGNWWNCIGAAGTGKSAMFGFFVLGDWLADPGNTVTVLVSTSLDALKARIWKYVCQWHESVIDKYRVGNFRQANPLGLLHLDEPTESHPQPQWKGAGILCVGFKAGDSSESIKNHLGRHLPRNRLIVDELQGVNPAVNDLWWNMGASGEFKMGGFGNPQSMFDPLADACVPAGHPSRLAAFDWLHREMMDVGKRRRKQWATEKGQCLMLDGMESPALDDPKFGWLIGKQHIEAARKSGENSVQWYAFIRGIFPPSGGANTLLSAREVQESGAGERGVAWDGPWQDWIWGDLAHGGEDAAVIQRARVGKAVGGVTMIELLERVTLTVDESKGFISQQMARQVEQRAREWGVPADRIAIDATATQGAMIDAIEERMRQRGVKRIHASGHPSDRPVKLGWPQTCKEAYHGRSEELAGNFREFVRAGQIRGMDNILAQQACSRATLPQEESGGKLKLDPDKRSANGGKSPNELDLVCVGCTALRDVGIHPGQGKAAPRFGENDTMTKWVDQRKAMDTRTRGHRIRGLMARY